MGLGGDARLYAFQALARIRPNLRGDLYLRYTSQDSYTIFSFFYARCIELLGVRSAALTLAMASKVWFLTAAGLLVRRLSDGRCAFLAVMLLIVTPGEYGAFGVFHYAEDWLTARSLAEALVITAWVLWFYEARLAALMVACIAMLVHPLMALPGLLVIICLGVSLRLSVLGATAGILLSMIVSLIALWRPTTNHFLAVMDADWLQVVRERSQFLFPQLWRARDWSLSARPLISLLVSSLATGDARVRKLCAVAALVGAAGLAVAVIASLIGPVGLLLQGQAWRWMWIASFASILMLAPTVLAIFRIDKVGPPCALLMLSGWTFSSIPGSASLASALALWLLRDRIDERTGTALRLIAVLYGAGLIAWGIRVSWTLAPYGVLGYMHKSSAVIESSPGLECLYIAVVGTIACSIRALIPRSALALTLTAGALFAASAYCVPRALQVSEADGTPEEITEFSDWRRMIPPDANVFLESSHNSAAFAWFTLERPSYLTVDQSSGVVFSRATAEEVRRRSQVLLPLMDPDWMILSSMNRPRSSATSGAKPSSIRPLTHDRLVRICADPQLDFVVASSNVGFEPIPHKRPQHMGEWYLYDCRRLVDEPTSRTGA